MTIEISDNLKKVLIHATAILLSIVAFLAVVYINWYFLYMDTVEFTNLFQIEIMETLFLSVTEIVVSAILFFVIIYLKDNIQIKQ